MHASRSPITHRLPEELEDGWSGADSTFDRADDQDLGSVGCKRENREQHKEVWKKVAKAVKNGTLLESIEPPLSYSNSKSLKAKPSPMPPDEPPKKRRLSA